MKTRLFNVVYSHLGDATNVSKLSYGNILLRFVVKVIEFDSFID